MYVLDTFIKWSGKVRKIRIGIKRLRMVIRVVTYTNTDTDTDTNTDSDTDTDQLLSSWFFASSIKNE